VLAGKEYLNILEEYRKQLIKLVEIDKREFTDPKVINISKEIDTLVARYVREEKSSRGK
jgi:hypothetical protein